MRLQNKKTGEIGNLVQRGCEDERIWVWVDNISKPAYRYNSLSELNKEWGDVPEEPKSKYLYIIDPTRINFINDVYKDDEPDWCEQALELGIGFETREEAEKAMEKLKAWKRLKDKGFKFEGIKEDYTRILQSQEPFRTGKRYLQFNKSEDEDWMKENWEDLDLLFGGEE